MALRILRYVWAAPLTAVGALAAVLVRATGGAWRVRDGVLEACGGLLRPLLGRRLARFAITIGHVVLGLDGGSLDEFHAHERVHVRQCERWGLLFPFAYLIASLVAWTQGRDAYLDNPFEREARRFDGRADRPR